MEHGERNQFGLHARLSMTTLQFAAGPLKERFTYLSCAAEGRMSVRKGSGSEE